MSPRPAHIFVVDDSDLVTGALRVLLEHAGYRVSVAPSVAEAIEFCTTEHPDVMLLDLGLDDGDGLDTLVRLRGIGREPTITVALTGDDSPATVARCKAAGCREVLLKPVPTRELLRRLEEWTADALRDENARA